MIFLFFKKVLSSFITNFLNINPILSLKITLIGSTTNLIIQNVLSKIGVVLRFPLINWVDNPYLTYSGNCLKLFIEFLTFR